MKKNNSDRPDIKNIVTKCFYLTNIQYPLIICKKIRSWERSSRKARKVIYVCPKEVSNATIVFEFLLFSHLKKTYFTI